VTAYSSYSILSSLFWTSSIKFIFALVYFSHILCKSISYSFRFSICCSFGSRLAFISCVRCVNTCLVFCKSLILNFCLYRSYSFFFRSLWTCSFWALSSSFFYVCSEICFSICSVDLFSLSIISFFFSSINLCFYHSTAFLSFLRVLINSVSSSASSLFLVVFSSISLPCSNSCCSSFSLYLSRKVFAFFFDALYFSYTALDSFWYSSCSTSLSISLFWLSALILPSNMDCISSCCCLSLAYYLCS